MLIRMKMFLALLLVLVAEVASANPAKGAYYYVQLFGGAFPVPISFEVMPNAPQDFRLRLNSPVMTPHLLLKRHRDVGEEGAAASYYGEILIGQSVACHRFFDSANWRAGGKLSSYGVRVFIYAPSEHSPLYGEPNKFVGLLLEQGGECVAMLDSSAGRWKDMLSEYGRVNGISK